MIKDDGEVIHFNNPKVQASLTSNTFAVTGHAEVKRKSSYVFIKELAWQRYTIISRMSDP